MAVNQLLVFWSFALLLMSLRFGLSSLVLFLLHLPYFWANLSL